MTGNDRPMSNLRNLGVLLGAMTLSCSRGPVPCTAPSACNAGQTCAAGRCARAGAEIAPTDAARIVVAPTELAVVSARGGDGAVPAESLLARPPAVGWSFFSSSQHRGEIALASPAHFSHSSQPLVRQPETQAVTVSVSRVLERWSASDVTWARLPKLSATEARAFAVTGPPKTLRIDVTSIVERWARGRADDQGIALMAPPEAPVGASYSTGISGGHGPRLDVYIR